MNKTAFAAALVAAFILVFVTPAYAQDSFTGPWVGATAGYDTFTAGDDEDDSSKNGVAYGISAGYDVNLGGVVLGIEAGFTESSVEASATAVFEDNDVLTLSAGRDIYAGLRVGVPVSDRVMVFGKAGYTNQRFSLTYTLNGDTESESESLDGWRVGGGVEVDFGAPFARIEYRYTNYGPFSNADLKTSRHQVMLTVGLRF